MRRKLKDDQRYVLSGAYNFRVQDHGPLWEELSTHLRAAGEKGLYGTQITAICRKYRNPGFGHYLFGQLGHLREVALAAP
jgi:hypothetical protein